MFKIIMIELDHLTNILFGFEDVWVTKDDKVMPMKRRFFESWKACQERYKRMYPND